MPNEVLARFKAQLVAVETALDKLEAHRATVRCIRLGDHRPVITIDRPSSGFLVGAMRRRERIGARRRSVIAAPFHGVQVEWEVSEYEAALPIPA